MLEIVSKLKLCFHGTYLLTEKVNHHQLRISAIRVGAVNLTSDESLPVRYPNAVRDLFRVDI